MGISVGYVSGPCSRNGRRLRSPKSSILIDNNGHACLTGFPALRITAGKDLVSNVQPDYLEMSRFFSPERFGLSILLDDHFPWKESDCYSLGMVIYEVLSGQQPFFQRSDADAMRHILNGGRPRKPHGPMRQLFTGDICEILEHCWKHQPSERISAKDVLQRLEKIPSPLNLPPGGDTETGMFLSFVPGSLLITFAGSTGRLSS